MYHEVADGVHSRLRHCILSNTTHAARKMGMTCYRVAIDGDTAKKTLGHLPHWWDSNTADGRLSLIESGNETSRFIVTYPLSHYHYVNLSCVFPSVLSKKSQMNSSSNSWYEDADRTEMVEVFKDFSEDLRKILR